MMRHDPFEKFAGSFMDHMREMAHLREIKRVAQYVQSTFIRIPVADWSKNPETKLVVEELRKVLYEYDR